MRRVAAFRAGVDWTFPESETGERGLRGALFLTLLALILIGLPVLIGTEVIF